MPPKSKPRRTNIASPSRVPGNLFAVLGRSAAYLTLAALASPVSQSNLQPVYGAIPLAVNHQQAIVLTTVLGFLIRSQLRSPPGRVGQYLAVWAFYVPVVLNYLSQFSGKLGPVRGPILEGFLSCHGLLIPSVYAAAEILERIDLRAKLGRRLATIVPAVFGLFHVVSFEWWFQTALPRLRMLYSIFTPVQMSLFMAAAYTYLAPSKLMILALPALLHTTTYNPHFESATTLALLNQTLHVHNWTLLDRRWSNTGYISVLDSLEMQYRVLRCDHSLLGGEWLLTDTRRKNEGWKVNEPIYSVFEMLEAVRLMELEPSIADAEARALVVGLGIGTAPKAFLAHGIDTTVVELDPVVHEYAMTYFGLPRNHTAIIQDAVSWVESTVAEGALKYDYIIHDVFPGGAEPLALFTDTFLTNLRSLLKPNGAIALNYAGDISAPLTTKVLHTIAVVFEHQCRIYRDIPPVSEQVGDKASIHEEDFTNMVIFCRNTPGPITFRSPTKADFLGSKSREHYMLPDPKLEIPFPHQDAQDRSQAQVLKQGEERQWFHQQAQSATRHWRIMRTVMPDAVWELW